MEIPHGLSRLVIRLTEISQQLNCLKLEQSKAEQALIAVISPVRGAAQANDLYQMLYWSLAGDGYSPAVRVDALQQMFGYSRFNPAPKPVPQETSLACPDCQGHLWVRHRSDLADLTMRGPTLTMCPKCGAHQRLSADLRSTGVVIPVTVWTK